MFCGCTAWVLVLDFSIVYVYAAVMVRGINSMVLLAIAITKISCFPERGNSPHQPTPGHARASDRARHPPSRKGVNANRVFGVTARPCLRTGR